jgi:hypothetical protein
MPEILGESPLKIYGRNHRFSMTLEIEVNLGANAVSANISTYVVDVGGEHMQFLETI